MRFAQTIASAGSPDLHSFQCDLCGVIFTGEAVTEAQIMAGALPPVDLAKGPHQSKDYDPERTKVLVEHMATLRLRWLANVKKAVSTPRAGLSWRLAQNRDWATGYRRPVPRSRRSARRDRETEE
ncbi:MAG TPA: hypothetical protein VL048_21180 [Xanthobacteraceae bacterium]|nr:hypothetical protein [Xanthobacteraceae bacterium]